MKISKVKWGTVAVASYTDRPSISSAEPGDRLSLMNSFDQDRDRVLSERAADWRNGAVVYQVFVDRFAPAGNLDAKRGQYASPRVLKNWNETPKKSSSFERGVCSHELEFWGGDLDSLTSRLDYLHKLGVDVVYLNPIFRSLTNHMYDTWDYHQVDPAYGTRADLARLSSELHDRGMRLVLDGVFNHMGLRSPLFQKAFNNPSSDERRFFQFTDKNSWGYIGWADVENMPQVNLEDRSVQDFIFGRSDSVVQSYLRKEKIDGWRLDVAADIGFNILSKLTRKVHATRAGSLVVGEIWSYPEEWFSSVDGVLNFHGRTLLLQMLSGKISGSRAATMWETMIADSGLEPILKSWLVLDNHDTPRLATLFPEERQREMARILQFTLPGSVCLYYGSELGMKGNIDPENRAPMKWDLVRNDNRVYAFHKRLLALRRLEPALRYGDFQRLATDHLFSFVRRTLSVRDTVVVVANPTDKEVTETIQIRESKIQNHSKLVDLLSSKTVFIDAGTLSVTLQPHQTLLLKVVTTPSARGYARYNRLF